MHYSAPLADGEHTNDLRLTVRRHRSVYASQQNNLGVSPLHQDLTVKSHTAPATRSGTHASAPRSTCRLPERHRSRLVARSVSPANPAGVTGSAGVADPFAPLDAPVESSARAGSLLRFGGFSCFAGSSADCIESFDFPTNRAPRWLTSPAKRVHRRG